MSSRGISIFCNSSGVLKLNIKQGLPALIPTLGVSIVAPLRKLSLIKSVVSMYASVVWPCLKYILLSADT